MTPEPPNPESPDLAAFLAAVRAGDSDAAAAMLSTAPGLARGRDAAGVSVILLAGYHGHAGLAAAIATHRDDLDAFEAAALGDVATLGETLREVPAVTARHATDGFTPLHLAAFFGRVAAVNVLVAAGADPDALAANGSQLRPLHSAAASRSAAVVRAVLSAGADPDTQQNGGFTALHAAAQHGDRAMTTALLAHGADREIAADDGRRALDFAREAKAPAVVALLERAGDVTSPD